MLRLGVSAEFKPNYRMKKKLICIERAWWHFSAHSGYAQFLRHVRHIFDTDLIRIPATDPAPPEARKSMVTRFLYYFRQTKASKYADIHTERLLLSRIKQILQEYGSITVHFLDGDLLFNHFSRLLSLRPKLRRRVKVCVTFHQPPSVLKNLITTKRYLNGIDKIILLGKNQLSFFPPHLHSRTTIIHHGVDTSHFTPLPSSNSSKSPQDSYPICLTAGHWLRDYTTLFNAIDKAPAEIRFKIVAYPDAVRPFGFRESNRIELLTGISDEELLHNYRNASLGLIPMLDSVANNVILEMMACGLPIITTDVGATKEYIGDGNAIFIPPKNPKKLLEGIIALTKNKGLQSRLSKNARTRVEEFDWEKITPQILEAYETSHCL